MKLKYSLLALLLLAVSPLTVRSVCAKELSGINQPFSVFEQYKKQPIKGRVALPSLNPKVSAWSRDHRLGVRALSRHQYDRAEELLLKAAAEAKRKLSKRDELLEIRLALARLYLKKEDFKEAYRLFSQNLGRVKHFSGSSRRDSNTALIETEIGMGRCLIAFGKDKPAHDHIAKALKLLEQKKDRDSQQFGYALQALALVHAKNGWYQDALPLFQESLKVFEEHPGHNSLDLAAVLREQAIYYHLRGNRKLARAFYERSYEIKEKIVHADQPYSEDGQLRFVWEPGSSRSKEIIDTEFPFRYLNAGKVRVAATVIDLWELLAVLITVTNTGNTQQEFELAEVSLLTLNNQGGETEFKKIRPVDPKSIDRIRRERVMWDLTHTRPWLANIQKTRTVRGLVPSRGHDLFRGPNVFGVYGDWKAISHIVPARVGVHVSRERIHSSSPANSVSLPGMLRGGGHSIKGHVPVFLEPFESRTGDIFYLNPRDKDIILKIPVGNAIFEIPFHTRKARIP